MGCCNLPQTSQGQYELTSSAQEAANTLPTFENMSQAYAELGGLPENKPHLLRHKKAQMVFMIVNIM